MSRTGRPREYNNYEVIYDPAGAYILVELTQNQWCYCDIDDWFNILIDYKWFADYSKSTNSFYAKTTIHPNKKSINIRMHRLILNIDNLKLDSDHEDRNTLNNMRYNLRICSREENTRNRNIQSSNISGFKGVSWNKFRNRWRVCISFSGKQKYIGSFTDIVDAAEAYDRAAEKYHKEFACLNFN